MYTSVALLTLSSFFVPSPQSNRPAWILNYWEAQKKGQSEKKPLAVFVGSGREGYHKVTGNGKLEGPIQKILAEQYVCVYLDTTGPGSQALATDFDIHRGKGLILSDRTGVLQAFHHDGELASQDLQRNLEKFADPDVVIQNTITNSRTSLYPPSGQTYTQPAAGRNC